MNASNNAAQRWMQIFRASQTDLRPPLIDIRPTKEFISEHVQYSTHFDGLFGVNGLFHRTNELPPPQNRAGMALIAPSPSKAAETLKFLTSKGYNDITFVSFSAARRSLPLQSGHISRPLWQPAPVLLQVLPLILKHLHHRTALDIGAGSGRDAAWLSFHRFKVTAVDRDPNLVEKATCLAAQTSYQAWFSATNEPQPCGSVNGIRRTFGTHLSEDAAFLQANASHLLLVVRFLRRGVLEQLWNAVVPGGFVVYEHFLQGCEEFPCGPRKMSQMLRPGELRQVFSPERGFSVWLEVESNLADGRPITRFVARRDNALSSDITTL